MCKKDKVNKPKILLYARGGETNSALSSIVFVYCSLKQRMQRTLFLYFLFFCPCPGTCHVLSDCCAGSFQISLFLFLPRQKYVLKKTKLMSWVDIAEVDHCICGLR